MVASKWSTVTLSDSKFIDNKTIVEGNHSESDGGAISLGAICNVNCSDTSFENNIAGDGGGGVYATTWGIAEFDRCNFFNNQSQKGGAIHASYGADLTLNSVRVGSLSNPNSSTGDGGGISVRNAEIDIIGKGNRIEGNNCGGRGGGVYLAKEDAGYGEAELNQSNINLEGVYIVCNSAKLTGGGVHIHRHTNGKIGCGLYMQSCWMQDNIAGTGILMNTTSDGLYVERKQTNSITNVIIYIRNSTFTNHNSSAITFNRLSTRRRRQGFVGSTPRIHNSAIAGNGVGLVSLSTNYSLTGTTAITGNTINTIIR